MGMLGVDHRCTVTRHGVINDGSVKDPCETSVALRFFCEDPTLEDLYTSLRNSFGTKINAQSDEKSHGPSIK